MNRTPITLYLRCTSFLLLCTSFAQVGAQTHEQITAVADSGFLDNATGRSQILFQTQVQNPGAQSTQLILRGSSLATGSHLLIKGLQTGFVQRLDARALMHAQAHSAWFDGSSVQIELHAAPHSRANRMRIEALATANQAPQISSICGSDNRVPSTDPRIARLPSGATAFLVGPDLALSAGHSVALAPGQLMEFRVPPSSAGGLPQRSHPDDQYSFRILKLRQNGIGDDWALLRISPNANTGKIPFQRNGAQFYSLGSPLAGHRLRISGYGSSNNPSRTFTQQTSTGPLRQIKSTALAYQVDTTNGSSGSPIADDSSGVCIGIHSNGGCTKTGGDNAGTRTDRADLLAAVRSARLGRLAIFGKACPSQKGLPRMSLQGAPQLGGAVTITIANLPLGQPGSLAVGFSAQYHGVLALPFEMTSLGMPGCTLYTSLDLSTALGTGLGSTGLAIPIPNQPSSAGLRVYLQYFFADAAANTSGVVASAGAEITLGS